MKGNTLLQWGLDERAYLSQKISFDIVGLFVSESKIP
jgi:hypothetical protein